ncbi:MAG TPA: hypothetical protein VFK32_03785 [Tepidiformaceae bacterium]|nr:hypothetical protein [Tepidiformaceae bacterium]
MDNDYSADLDEILSTLQTAEVVSVRFVVLGERLLLDFRTSDVDGPLVKVVPRVRSVQERYESLRKMRPRFDDPPRIISIFWPKFASSLESSGVKDAVLERVSESGHPDAVRRAAIAFEELVALERARQMDAVQGEGFRTLWSASARLR